MFARCKQTTTRDHCQCFFACTWQTLNDDICGGWCQPSFFPPLFITFLPLPSLLISQHPANKLLWADTNATHKPPRTSRLFSLKEAVQHSSNRWSKFYSCLSHLHSLLSWPQKNGSSWSDPTTLTNRQRLGLKPYSTVTSKCLVTSLFIVTLTNHNQQHYQYVHLLRTHTAFKYEHRHSQQ